jgi:hypothetical protein
MEPTNPLRDIVFRTAYYAVLGLLVAQSVDSSRRTVDWVFKKLK